MPLNTVSPVIERMSDVRRRVTDAARFPLLLLRKKFLPYQAVLWIAVAHEIEIRVSPELQGCWSKLFPEVPYFFPGVFKGKADDIPVKKTWKSCGLQQFLRIA